MCFTRGLNRKVVRCAGDGAVLEDHTGNLTVFGPSLGGDDALLVVEWFINDEFAVL